jgi:hypothetical protein
VAFEDRTITCIDCGTEFVFGAEEQAALAAKGVTGAPKRCPSCRAKLGAAAAAPVGRLAERFDDEGQRVLAYAQEEARRLEHRWLGTEHLLLGLLRAPEGAAGRVLQRLGVDLAETRAAIDHWVRGIPAGQVPLGPTAPTESVPLAQRAQAALEAAIADAKAQMRDHARADDLLLALFHGYGDSSPGRGVAAVVLNGFGVTADRVRAMLADVLAEDAGKPSPAHPYQLAGTGKWDDATKSIAQWREQRRQGRRYSLVLPEELFQEVERLAERQNTSVVELLRRFTRLGLLAMQLQERPDAALIIREGGTERQLMLL